MEDKMTEAKKVRFELPADNGNGPDNAKVLLFCNAGKLLLGDFRPSTRWRRPIVRLLGTAADGSHRPRGPQPQQSWLELGERTLPGHGQRHDAGTNRAQVLKIDSHPQIAEFTPAGLIWGAFGAPAGLTPKKP